MQRFTAIITLTAFLLVITMPMLPVPPACAHAAMGNDEACAMACHDGTPSITPDDMDMSDLDMGMDIEMVDNHEHDTAIAKQDITSDKKPACRIECGCGCNSAPDQFTLTLSPHLPSHPMALIEPIASEFAMMFIATKTTRNIPPDSPPPRHS